MIGYIGLSRGRGLGRRGRLGRLGVNSAVVNGSLIYSNPIAVSKTPVAVRPKSPIIPVRPIGPARPVAITNGSQTSNGSGIVPTVSNPWGGMYSNTYGGQPGGTYAGNPAQTSQTNLAQLTLLYQTNPSLLTQAQWQQLQAAGVIPSTVPYGDSSLITGTATSSTTDSGIDPATGVPYATELAEAEAGSSSSIGTTLSTAYAGVPLYAWLGGAVVLYFLMSGGKRR